MNVSLLPVTFVSQVTTDALEHRNDCGAACAAMLVKSYIRPNITVDEVYNAMKPAGDDYLNFTDLTVYLRSQGLGTVAYTNLTLHGLFDILSNSRPFIALVQYGYIVDAMLGSSNFRDAHFVNVVGMDTANVYIHDPLSICGPTAIPHSVFLRAWDGTKEANGNASNSGIAVMPPVKVEPDPEKRKVIARDGLRVRTGPGTQYQILRVLPCGTQVPILDLSINWARIGIGEWVCADYLG